MRGFWDFWLAPVVLLVAILVSIFAMAAWVDERSCHEKWAKSGYRAEWGLWPGCRLEVDGRLIPEGMMRRIEQ